MEIDVESLERATLDAVAPDSVESIKGWLLPFDTTTIGRAISAVPLQHDNLDPVAIAEIESIYAHRGYKAQFRVADVVGLNRVHGALRQHGYTPQQATLTMVGGIRDWRQKCNNWTVQLTQKPSHEWMKVYLTEGFDPVDGANRVKALSRSVHMVYASICDQVSPIAAGAASFSQDWAGLHGLRTAEHRRNKGCARALIAALGESVVERGMNRCYLQVEETNTPAIFLYSRLGFQTAWRYHYWRKQS